MINEYTHFFIYTLNSLLYSAKPQPWLNPSFHLICAIIHAKEWTEDKWPWLWTSSEPICCLMVILDFSSPFTLPYVWWLFCFFLLFSSNPQYTTPSFTLRWWFLLGLHWENLNKQERTSIDSQHHHHLPTGIYIQKSWLPTCYQKGFQHAPQVNPDLQTRSHLFLLTQWHHSADSPIFLPESWLSISVKSFPPVYKHSIKLFLPSYNQKLFS